MKIVCKLNLWGRIRLWFIEMQFKRHVKMFEIYNRKVNKVNQYWEKAVKEIPKLFIWKVPK